jgi:tetratricopeptide (TPR) repeat protein
MLVLAFVCLALTTPMAVQASSAHAASSPQQAVVDKRIRRLREDLENLRTKQHDTSVKLTVALAPVALLVAILALGGGLGVVFSIRDQRRISQLHELTVGGEVSSQRRAEQGYASFLDQSQTTLALVNDTLKLAKDATDREAHSMEIKAQQRIDAIEEKAQQLMQETFVDEQFAPIVEKAVRRERLHAIAGELRDLEGYLSLQSVTLPPYTRFVKAIDLFLADNPDTAIGILRRASEEPIAGDLHRFILYWLGYMLTTTGEYQEAITKFRDDELGLPDDHPEHIQLDRIIIETEFFELAKKTANSDATGADPHARFRAAADLLDRLGTLAAEINPKDKRDSIRQVALAIARTRADILEWVAYDHKHLDESIDDHGTHHAVADAREHLTSLTAAIQFTEDSDWGVLADVDTFRAWALLQAEAICVEQQKSNDRDFALAFALAECQFKLRERDAEAAFAHAASLLRNEFGLYREQRREASLHQSMLICHSRLLRLRRGNAGQRSDEARQVMQAYRDAADALGKVRPTHVTVFSHIQRRNLTQDEFRREVSDILDQEEKEMKQAGA